ncbi:MAG TPA: hypothetical protein VM492_15860 [Sumerlaeia bacterium]|nr:hypothetical protein [Sumerlaeia bacterium]
MRADTPLARIRRRRLAGVALLGALALAGCPKKQIPEAPKLEPAQAVEKGESVTVEFPADGAWHPSGFLGRPGDRIRFIPLGDAAFLSKKAILVHIGRTRSQMVYAGKPPQRVTNLGEILFRVDLDALGPYSESTVRVRVENLAK